MIFLSHIIENLRVGTLHCFQKLQISKKFIQKKGKTQVSVETFFCLTVPKKFVVYPSLFPKSSRSEIFYTWEGNITIFCWMFFSSQSVEKYCGGTFQCFLNTRLSINFVHMKRTHQFSVGIFLSHTAEKLRGGTLLYFPKIRVSKSFIHKRAISQFSVQALLNSQRRKVSWKNLSMVQKNLGFESFFA